MKTIFIIMITLLVLLNTSCFAFGTYALNPELSSNCRVNHIKNVMQMNGFEIWVFCDSNLDNKYDYVVVMMHGFGENHDQYGAVLIYNREEAEAFLECLVDASCDTVDAMIEAEIAELKAKQERGD